MTKVTNSKEIMEIVNDIGKQEILKLRECCNDKDGFDNYVYKAADKIFRKLVFPYFRFEALQICIFDAKENSELYSNLDMKKVDFLCKKLQTICMYLNLALDEQNKMLSEIYQS